MEKKKQNSEINSMSLVDFISSCGVTAITSNATFFLPNIPEDKLANAVRAYGNGASKDDVLILIDDTLWGGAREGAMITKDAILINSKGNKTSQFKFAELSTVSSESGNIFLNQRHVGQITKPGALELRYVFSVIDDYIKMANRTAESKPATNLALDFQLLTKICSRYLIPDCYSAEELQTQGTHPSFGDKKYINTPGYYVGKNIPPIMEKMARFCLAIRAEESLIALQNITINDGNAQGCFVISTNGLYSKDRNSQDFVYIPWIELKELTVTSSYIEGTLCGVILSNGKKFPTSWKNAVVKPFGASIVADLISALNVGTSSPSLAEIPIGPLPNDVRQVAITSYAENSSESRPLISEWELVIGQIDATQDEPELAQDPTRGLKDLDISNFGVKEGKSSETLINVISKLFEKNKSKIIPLIKEKAGSASLVALRDDANIEKLAVFLYALLPGVIRLILKEEMFVKFMQDNRNKIVDRILALEESSELPGGDALEQVHAKRALSTDALSQASPAPRRSLSSFKTTTASKLALEPKAVYFSNLKNELIEYVANFNLEVDRLDASDLAGDEFQLSARQHYSTKMLLGMVSIALDVAPKLKRKNPVWTGDELKVLFSDLATAQSIFYCIATMGCLLRREAGFDEEQVIEFLSPFLGVILFPYFQEQAGVVKPRSLRARFHPFEQLEDTEVMRRFKLHTKTFGQNLMEANIDSLLDNFSLYLSSAVREQFASDEDHKDFSTKLQNSNETFRSILAELDSDMEGLIVDFLEVTQD